MKIIKDIFTKKAAEDERPAEKTGKKENALFAGGCFWCIESAFLDIPGVEEVTSGYTGGSAPNPTYEMVSAGYTGHYEAVMIRFNPEMISYNELLDIFWDQIDPTDPGGQFADRGPHYRTAVFYFNEKQRIAAELSKTKLSESKRFGAPVVTEILEARKFYPAEDYHHRYCRVHPERYSAYKKGSGREGFILKHRAAPKAGADEKTAGHKNNPLSKGELKSALTPLQYKVAVEGGTEPPFQNDFWNNKKPGLYVDVISGEPLFISSDKFDSGTGWPSFTRPVSSDAVRTKSDLSFGMARTEVISGSGSHLGHLFNDGPGPEGNRYCINSASLRFISVEELEKEGYAEYESLIAGADKVPSA